MLIAELYHLCASFDAEGGLGGEVASTRSQQLVILEDVGHGLRGHGRTYP